MNSLKFRKSDTRKKHKKPTTPQTWENGTLSLTWPEPTPVTFATQTAASRFVIKKGEWSVLEGSSLIEFGQRFVRAFGDAMTIEQALSLRSTLLQEKAIKRHSQLQRSADDLVHMYREMQLDILSISKQMDYPPVACLRAILTATTGGSKASVKRMLKEGCGLSERDQRELATAAQHDLVAGVDQGTCQQMALRFEEVIGQYLDTHGVKYRTQTQQQEGGILQNIPTPDFLLTSPITINGNKVHWIDAKNFFGVYTFIQMGRLRKQMRRYAEAYGPGATVWSQGYCEMTKMQGVLMLDAHFITESMAMTPPPTPIEISDQDPAAETSEEDTERVATGKNATKKRKVFGNDDTQTEKPHKRKNVNVEREATKKRKVEKEKTEKSNKKTRKDEWEESGKVEAKVRTKKTKNTDKSERQMNEKTKSKSKADSAEAGKPLKSTAATVKEMKTEILNVGAPAMKATKSKKEKKGKRENTGAETVKKLLKKVVKDGVSKAKGKNGKKVKASRCEETDDVWFLRA